MLTPVLQKILSHEGKIDRAIHLLKTWGMLGAQMSIEILFDCDTIRIATVGNFVFPQPLYSQPMPGLNHGYENQFQLMGSFPSTPDGYSFGGLGTRG